MHIGTKNPQYKYQMKNKGQKQDLNTSKLEKDVGILISNVMKWESQVNSAASKANSMLAIVNKTFKFKDKEVIKTLYYTYMRPHLEFDIQVWSPYLQKDIDPLEQMQERATK
jgi:hypothetical protein